MQHFRQEVQDVFIPAVFPLSSLKPVSCADELSSLLRLQYQLCIKPPQVLKKQMVKMQLI